MNKYWETQFRLYPSCSAQDFLKFLYQSELGSGHLILNQKDNYQALLNEYKSLSYDENHILYEDISTELVRVHLEAIQEEDLPFFHFLFMKSASYTSSKQQLNAVYDKVLLSYEDTFPFSKQSLEVEIQKQKENDFPLVSHSASFRKKYHPHYRLMLSKYIPYIPVLKQIYNLKKPSIICIEGGCASGKSTLASLLSELFSFPVVSMDDFFLQPQQRTNERLNEVGGNIDYERYYKEVVIPLRNKQSFSYQCFDCSVGQLNKTKYVLNNTSIIIEGVYSTHPYFKQYEDYTIYLTISKEEQLRRLAIRNPLLYERFIKEWIPKEDAYFQAFNVKEKANYIFNIEEKVM